MLNSYANNSEQTTLTKEITTKKSNFVRNANIVLMSAIVIGSMVLGGFSAANDANALGRAFVQVTTVTK